MTKDLVKILDDFKDKKILVIGDVILDWTIWGSIERLNPEQPASPLVKGKTQTYNLGGAANVANNIRSLGAECDLLGNSGEGVFGNKIVELCKERGINFKNFYDGNPSIVKLRSMAHGQQISRTDLGEWDLKKISKGIESEILEYLEKDLDGHDFVILSDYDKRIFTQELSYNIIRIANEKKIKTLVDPKPKNAELFKHCTVIRPNVHEAAKITGIEYSGKKESIEAIGKELCWKVKSDYAIITCGEQGVFAYDVKKDYSIFVDTKARKIAEVSGAGDTFAAAFTLGMSSGLNMENSAKLANYASGVVVGKVGTATVTVDEIKAYVNGE